MQDLLTDEPFTRKDIIHIQDPLNVSGRLIHEFHHVRFVSGQQAPACWLTLWELWEAGSMLSVQLWVAACLGLDSVVQG